MLGDCGSSLLFAAGDKLDQLAGLVDARALPAGSPVMPKYAGPCVSRQYEEQDVLLAPIGDVGRSRIRLALERGVGWIPATSAGMTRTRRQVHNTSRQPRRPARDSPRGCRAPIVPTARASRIAPFKRRTKPTAQLADVGSIPATCLYLVQAGQDRRPALPTSAPDPPHPVAKETATGAARATRRRCPRPATIAGAGAPPGRDLRA